ncbi:putative reverse transcriptase domain-containing protein [Tanacetum coccineum]
MFSVWRFDCFPLSKGDDTFWFGSKTIDDLLGGAIDSSEANGIIHDPKLELENSHFTFDLVPLSYESVDVVVGENWLLRHKAEMVCHEKVVKMPWMRNGHVEVYSYAFWVNQCTIGFHGVNVSGGVRVAREDDRRVSEGREDVREVFQQRGKREQNRSNLDEERIWKHAWKREKVIACTSRQLKVLMKDCMANAFDFEAKYHLGKANVDVVPWSRKKE